MSTHKYPTWDRNRSVFLKLGFILALLTVIILFQTESRATPPEEYDIEPLEEILTTPERTVQKKKVKTPPVKPPEPEDIIEKIDEQDEFVEEKEEPIEDKENTPVRDSKEEYILPKVDTSAKTIAPPTPAPEPDPEPEETPLVIRAEKMPAFDGCVDIIEEEDRRKCTEEALLSFIYSKLRYPVLAKENGIEGRVVSSFVVDKNGRVRDIEIRRDIGGGCGNVVEKILEQMPTWIPGKQNGRPVHVMYTIPIKFQLD